MKIGCHVSIAGGVFNAPINGGELGCEVIQIFTRSPQGGKSAPLTPEAVKQFKIEKTKNKIESIYVHCPYFINFASSNNRIRYGSISSVREELERSSLLGAKYVMTHLGSSKDLGEEESFTKTVEGLKKIFDGYTGSAKLLIENSAGSGSSIGSDFEKIGKIFKAVKNTKLAGVCLDTQHSFAYGYNWKDNFEENIKILDKAIGIKNIKMMHANDSMTECASKVDRHEHIGKGKIGLDGFKNLVAFAKENNIDMICETKMPGVEDDIKKLKELRG